MRPTKWRSGMWTDTVLSPCGSSVCMYVYHLVLHSDVDFNLFIALLLETFLFNYKQKVWEVFETDSFSAKFRCVTWSDIQRLTTNFLAAWIDTHWLQILRWCYINGRIPDVIFCGKIDELVKTNDKLRITWIYRHQWQILWWYTRHENDSKFYGSIHELTNHGCNVLWQFLWIDRDTCNKFRGNKYELMDPGCNILWQYSWIDRH